MLRKSRLPTPENVVVGSRFTVKLPIGPTYTKVDLILGGTFVVADIENLEFAINGRPVRRYATGTDLNKLNVRVGRPASTANNILTLYFRRDELEEIEDASLFDIGTSRPDPNNPADRDSVLVETLTISGEIGSGASSPTMTAWATTTSNTRPLRMLQKVLYFPKAVSVSTTGTENELDGLPSGASYPNAVLLGIHLKESTAGITTHLRATANIGGASVDLLEDVPESILIQSDESRGYTAQTGMMHWDLVGESGQALDGLPLGAVGDLRLRPKCLHASITTGQLQVYVDLADTFQGI